jgi:hypothetical protein
MKRLLLISAGVLAACGVAAAPAVAGLTDNPSFSHQIPIRVPSQANLPRLADDHGTDVPSPTSTIRPSRSLEPGDDRGSSSREAEPGDDRGSSTEPGDDRGGNSGSGSSGSGSGSGSGGSGSGGSGSDDNGGDGGSGGGSDDGSSHG